MSILNFLRQERTTEAKVFEAVAAALILIMWAILLRCYLRAEADVPVHFGLDGSPDRYGSPAWLLGLGAIATVAELLCLVSAYAPESMINMPCKITTPRQLRLARRMVRAVAIEVALVFIVVALMMGGAPGLEAALLVLVGLMAATTVYYCVKAAKAA